MNVLSYQTHIYILYTFKVYFEVLHKNARIKETKVDMATLLCLTLSLLAPGQLSRGYAVARGKNGGAS